jgi:hypothetical protein
VSFFGRDGSNGKLRRAVSRESSYDGDVTKLAEVLRKIGERIGLLESVQRPDYNEYELEVSSGVTYTLQHDFGGAVRWYVVDWAPTEANIMVPSAAPAFVRTQATTAGSLVLRSTCDGKAVIRVESSQIGVV